MVPLDGPVREDVGLLGSPCFEIPRSVDRDRAFDDLKTADELRAAAGKNRHNLVTCACSCSSVVSTCRRHRLELAAVARVYARFGAWA